MTLGPDAPAPPVPLATPMRRLGGFLIDSVLYAALLFFLLLPEGDLQPIAEGDAPIPGSTLLIYLLLVGVYQVVLTALRGQTIGKMAVGTKVIDPETGRIPSWQSSFIRWGAPAALSTIPYLGFLAIGMYAWLLWDARRQGLHDKAARTLVVKGTS